MHDLGVEIEQLEHGRGVDLARGLVPVATVMLVAFHGPTIRISCAYGIVSCA